MAYSVNLLSTKAECDAVLARANDDRARLVFRQTVAARSQTLGSDAAVTVTTKLAIANANITTLTALIPTLPVEAREERELEKRKYERQRDELLDEQKDGGAVGLLDRELDAKLVELQLAEVDAFLAAVQARKDALPN